MSATTAIRWSTIAAVTALAVIAGWVSYVHAHDVVVRYGQTGPVSYAYPLILDGLVYTASMVLLDAARRKIPAHWLAWGTLILGIILTAAVNFWDGYNGNWIRACIFALPAAVLVLGYEMLMLLIRNEGHRQEQVALADAPVASFGGISSAPTRERLAEQRFADDLAKGRVPPIRTIKRELGVGSGAAPQIQAHLRSKVAA